MSAEECQSAPTGLITSPEDALAAFSAAGWEMWPKEPCPIPTNDAWTQETSAMLMSLRLAW